MLLSIDTLFLAGSVSHSLLRKQIGRPVSSLPIAADETILSAWNERVTRAGLDGSRRLLISASQENPLGNHDRDGLEMEVIVDERTHRGVGGVVKDALERRDDGLPSGSTVLVVEATSSPAVDLGELARIHTQGDAAITFGMDHDQKYAGCLLLDREILELVPPVGFFDLKEQLVQAARQSGARLEAAEITRKSIRVHTLEAWRRAVREWSMIDAHERGEARQDCSIVDSDAEVAGVTIIDSIVMEGARVGSGAIIARSAIGPGATVPGGIRVIDSVYA